MDMFRRVSSFLLNLISNYCLTPALSLVRLNWFLFPVADNGKLVLYIRHVIF